MSKIGMLEYWTRSKAESREANIGTMGKKSVAPTTFHGVQWQVHKSADQAFTYCCCYVLLCYCSTCFSGGLFRKTDSWLGHSRNNNSFLYYDALFKKITPLKLLTTSNIGIEGTRYTRPSCRALYSIKKGILYADPRKSY